MTLTISPYTTRLNHKNAYWMARISNATYADNVLENLKAEDPEFIEAYHFSQGNTQAVLVEHQHYLCFAFRGTDEVADWIDNINIIKTNINETECETHAGFLNHFNSVWEDIEAKCNELININPRPIFFTGHSLGGAVATIATARWALESDRQFSSTYTFGQPRAISLKSSRMLNAMFGSRFFRFHNNNDIVSRVPTRLRGFSHVGQTIYIDRDNSLHTDIGFWHRFQDRLRGAIDALNEKGIDHFTDHDMEKYLHAIKNWDMQD